MPFFSLASAGFIFYLDFASGLWLLVTGLSIWKWTVPETDDESGWTRYRALLIILATLGVLAYFKVGQGIGGTHPIIPLGISFYSFKLVHFAIDVRRGEFERGSFFSFLGYLFMFPAFTAGPIERYDHFEDQLGKKFEIDFLFRGLIRIGFGLIKKFLFIPVFLIEPAGELAAPPAFHAHLSELSQLEVWKWMTMKFLIAYLDFSAYSDIAIGGMLLFGIKLRENFRWPILASNLGDFWKRWHISLAGWCQSYVYMPLLGATRRPYLAVFATFFVMGLWHAISFHWVAWGLWHGSGVAMARVWTQFKRRRNLPYVPGWLSWFLGWSLTMGYVICAAVFISTYDTLTLKESLEILTKALLNLRH